MGFPRATRNTTRTPARSQYRNHGSGLPPACGKPLQAARAARMQGGERPLRQAQEGALLGLSRQLRPARGGRRVAAWRRCGRAAALTRARARRRDQGAAGRWRNDGQAAVSSVRRDAGRAQSKLESDSPRRQELSAEAKEAEASLLRQTVQFPALAVEPRGVPEKTLLAWGLGRASASASVSPCRTSSSPSWTTRC